MNKLHSVTRITLSIILSVSMIFPGAAFVSADTSDTAGTTAVIEDGEQVIAQNDAADSDTQSTSDTQSVSDTPGTSDSSQGLGYIDDGVDVPAISDDQTYSTSGNLHLNGLPSSYTLPESRYTPARNQGSYNTCWSFSAIASLESSILTNYPNVAGLTRDTLDLSELQAGYYTYHRTNSSQPKGCEGDNVSLYKNYYEVGGNDIMAGFSLARGCGPVSESTAPYSSIASPNFSDSVMAYSNTIERYKLTNLDFISMKDRNLVKQKIIDSGAVASGYQMNQYYYNESTCAFYDSNPYEYSYGHATTIIGWDDNYSKSNFKKGNQPSGNGAWRCKNSWGSNWGQNGFFWISYYDAPLQQEAAASYQVQKPSGQPTSDLTYQYDGGLMTDDRSWENSKTLYGSNVFTASSRMKLRSVSFTTSYYGQNYTIYIYRAVKNKPNSGVLVGACTTSGTAKFYGLHNVQLKNAVTVNKGEKFAVVVRINTGRTNAARASISAEKSGSYEDYYGRKIIVGTVHSDYGESFISTNGKNWYDMKTAYGSWTGNLRIKAFGSTTADATWERISGKNRYETAAAVAKKAFSNSYAAVLVSGEKFPDALTANAYAGARNIPLIFTKQAALPDSTKSLISTLGIHDITIIGGEDTISTNVENELMSECSISQSSIHRVAGINRYDTAIKLYEYGVQQSVWRSSNVTCIVATGTKAADALSMAPWAYCYAEPIFLADKTATLSDEALRYTKNFQYTYVIGSTAAVSDATMASLNNPTRLAGSNRYKTSVAIAKKLGHGANMNGDDYHYTAFASGTDNSFADALAAGMLQGKNRSPLILVSGTKGPGFDFLASQFLPAVDAHLSKKEFKIIGGSKTISTAAINTMKNLW